MTKVIQPLTSREPDDQPPEAAVVNVKAKPARLASKPSAIQGAANQRPDAAPQWTVGVAASEMGWSQNQRGRNWRSSLLPTIVAVVAIVALGAGLLITKDLHGYGRQTVRANGFGYSIAFTRHANQVTIQGKTYLEGKDLSGKNGIIVSVNRLTATNHECYTSADGKMKLIAQETVNGAQHSLCFSPQLRAYTADFTNRGTWYFIVILPKNGGSSVDMPTAEAIAGSVKISS